MGETGAGEGRATEAAICDKKTNECQCKVAKAYWSECVCRVKCVETERHSNDVQLE